MPNYNIIQMILQITPIKSSPASKKLTWKQELKRMLYKKNKQMMNKSEPSLRREENEGAAEGLARLFKSERIALNDQTEALDSYSYYSSYVPLKMQTKFDDQLTLTFPYIKQIYEKGRINDRNYLLTHIADGMKESKAANKVDEGWLAFLKRYICGIDSIHAAQIYLQLKKHGTSKLDQLHLKYGGQCCKLVFFERVSLSSAYFKKFIPINNSQFSVQLQEEVNQVSMAKTMKQLFCSICMTYDCSQHSLSQLVKEKQYQYISPKNMRSDEQNLKNSIGICLAYRQLLKKGHISQEQHCSKTCYKKLNTKQWQNLQRSRGKLLSPVVKGLAKIGIEMFSYSPCDISFINQEKVTCSHIFLFLIEDYNLLAKLQQKLMDSQEQMLIRQKKAEVEVIKNSLRQEDKNMQKNQAINSCFHYFKGQQPFDVNCQNCPCAARKFCLPECMCDQDCPRRRRGCNCKKQDCRTKKCICYTNSQQCDPLICVNCFGEDRSRTCNNHRIMSGQFKKTKVGISSVMGAGLGLFAGEPIKKDQLLMIYSGQLIEPPIDALRESLRVDQSFYNFGTSQGTIDARFMGNLSRFINHADQGRQNLESHNILTEGRYKIGLYAIKDIEKGEQLFFDYDGEGELYKNFKQKYPFIHQRKKKRQ